MKSRSWLRRSVESSRLSCSSRRWRCSPRTGTRTSRSAASAEEEDDREGQRDLGAAGSGRAASAGWPSRLPQPAPHERPRGPERRLLHGVERDPLPAVSVRRRSGCARSPRPPRCGRRRRGGAGGSRRATAPERLVRKPPERPQPGRDHPDRVVGEDGAAAGRLAALGLLVAPVELRGRGAELHVVRLARRPSLLEEERARPRVAAEERRREGPPAPACAATRVASVNEPGTNTTSGSELLDAAQLRPEVGLEGEVEELGHHAPGDLVAGSGR